MSLRVVVSLASFLFFACFAAAQISSVPKCDISWSWTVNVKEQDACTIAAYLISTCNGGSYTLGPLKKKGDVYAPAGPVMNATGCMCNTIMYSLLSACDGCQGNDWDSYSDYTKKCKTVSTPGSFPYPVPDGTYVPHWTRFFRPGDIMKKIDFQEIIKAGLFQLPQAGPGIKIDDSTD